MVAVGARQAAAFDYVEHGRITHAGVRLFLQLIDPGLGNQPPSALDEGCNQSAAPAECANRKAFLSHLEAELASTHTCGPPTNDANDATDRFFHYAPNGCFSISDIPALAGDHAATPLLLRWKWFNDYSKAQTPEPTLGVALKVLWGLGKGTQIFVTRSCPWISPTPRW